MNRSHHAYSVNTAEELEAQRDAFQAPMLAEFHRGQTEGHRTTAYSRCENLKVLASELVDLLDLVEAGPDGRAAVDMGSLGRRLRIAEGELMAAIDAFAGELGVVGVVSN
jgi:hypothetical protein